MEIMVNLSPVSAFWSVFSFGCVRIGLPYAFCAPFPWSLMENVFFLCAFSEMGIVKVIGACFSSSFCVILQVHLRTFSWGVIDCSIYLYPYVCVYPSFPFSPSSPSVTSSHAPVPHPHYLSPQPSPTLPLCPPIYADYPSSSTAWP